MFVSLATATTRASTTPLSPPRFFETQQTHHRAMTPEPRDPTPSPGANSPSPTPAGEPSPNIESAVATPQPAPESTPEPAPVAPAVPGEYERIPSALEQRTPSKRRTGRTPPGRITPRGYRSGSIPGSAITAAAVIVVVPIALLWIVAFMTSRRPNDPLLEWAAAASQSSPDRAVLRPDSIDPGAPVVIVTRENNRIVGRSEAEPDPPLWTFPAVPAGLLGSTLDDTVLWVPRTGPFAISHSGGEAGALLVLWKSGGSPIQPVRLTLLSASGRTLWSTTLDPGATPVTLQWLEPREGKLTLAAIGSDRRTTILTIDTPKPAPSVP